MAATSVDLRDERPVAGGRRHNRQVGDVVRHRGVVDLRVGLDGRDPQSIGNIQSSIPGEVFDNLVIVGSATGEGYMSHALRLRCGHLVSRRDRCADRSGSNGPSGFELCGDTPASCRWAESRVEAASVLLANAAGATRVRYAWGGSPVCPLIDGSGLPAGPVRDRHSLSFCRH
jgi:hypothetical protein